jgi:hypothetical protein
MAGNPVTVGSGKQDARLEDVQFCYDFVVDTVLELQEQDTKIRGVATRRMLLRGH